MQFALLLLLLVGVVFHVESKPQLESSVTEVYNGLSQNLRAYRRDEVPANEDEKNAQDSGDTPDDQEQADNVETGETENADVKQLSQEDQRKKQQVEKFAAAFTKVLTHTLLLTVGPSGHVFGIVTTILLYSSGLAGGRKSDLWSTLKDRIKAEVGKGLAEYHFHQTKKFRLAIEAKIAKKERLKVEDWDEVVARNKFDFFPQTNPATGYDERLAILPVTWVTYMVAALGQLVNKDLVPKCSVADELKKVKEDLKNAAKEMFRKRYKAMNGIGYSHKGQTCSGTIGCTDTNTWYYKMVDSSTDEKFNIIKRARGDPSWSEYNKFKQNTVDAVWDKMVSKINAYFTPDICREGCDCPTPLTKGEITWSYVSSCYGKLDDQNYCNQCDTPCMNYEESYTWCGCTGNGIRRDWTWDYCKKANWDACRGETPYPFNRAIEFEDSRDKKKKKKINKGKAE